MRKLKGSLEWEEEGVGAWKLQVTEGGWVGKWSKGGDRGVDEEGKKKRRLMEEIGRQC